MVTPRLMHVRNAPILLISCALRHGWPWSVSTRSRGREGACASAVPSAVRSVRTRCRAPVPVPVPVRPSSAQSSTPRAGHTRHDSRVRERERAWVLAGRVLSAVARRGAAVRLGVYEYCIR